MILGSIYEIFWFIRYLWINFWVTNTHNAVDTKLLSYTLRIQIGSKYFQFHAVFRQKLAK